MFSVLALILMTCAAKAQTTCKVDITYTNPPADSVAVHVSTESSERGMETYLITDNQVREYGIRSKHLPLGDQLMILTHVNKETGEVLNVTEVKSWEKKIELIVDLGQSIKSETPALVQK
jgi:hypothetical protein